MEGRLLELNLLRLMISISNKHTSFMQDQRLNELRIFAEQELFGNILPFWRNRIPDWEYGGFLGETDFTGNTVLGAPKGLILHARILWTFSRVYSLTQDPIDKDLASRAFLYLCNSFYDEEYGGYYWTLDYDGRPQMLKKQVYALAFVMYGMSEYYLISGDNEALKRSTDLFNLIESRSFDNELNGYYEGFSREWSEIEDLRLSDKDMNERKTMNTHLHILEAYTNLYRIWKNESLLAKIENLVRIFLDKIISPGDFHLQLFFNDEWEVKSNTISYGHDIEAGWLIHEAALVTGIEELISEVERLVPSLTLSALEGLSEEGGLFHEGDRLGRHIDHQYEWWPQAEALVGLLNTFELTGHERFLADALQVKEFIRKYIIDHQYGEWHFRVGSDLKPIEGLEKSGLWKCPYHNGRACIEIIQRIKKIQ